MSVGIKGRRDVRPPWTPPVCPKCGRVLPGNPTSTAGICQCSRKPHVQDGGVAPHADEIDWGDGRKPRRP